MPPILQTSILAVGRSREKERPELANARVERRTAKRQRTAEGFIACLFGTKDAAKRLSRFSPFGAVIPRSPQGSKCLLRGERSGTSASDSPKWQACGLFNFGGLA